MLVYITAFSATKGSNVLDLLGGKRLPWMKFTDVFKREREAISDTAQDDYVYTTDEANVFYNDLPPAEQEKWIAKLKPMSKHAFLEPASYEPWHDLPCMYLLCELDQALPIAVQEMMADVLEEQPVSFRCAASHSPFLSVPDKVADAVELGVREGAKRSGI